MSSQSEQTKIIDEESTCLSPPFPRKNVKITLASLCIMGYFTKGFHRERKVIGTMSHSESKSELVRQAFVLAFRT